MSEYVKAYDAAMTVERMSTSDYGHYVLYGGKKYTDKVELTRAMAKAASANVRTVYYDPSSEAIEKYFSDAAFDGTVYLNSDYIFARTSPAETNRVTLTDKDGAVTEIDFFTPVSAYNLASGSYTVCEEDIYGNKTEYTVIVDRDVPKLYLNLNGDRVEVQSHNVYTARYFALSELIDALDDYALASVTEDATGKTEYFLASECENAVFTAGGTYTVRTYDRNGNSESLMVSLEGERQWALDIGSNATTVMLRGNGTVFDGVLVDGVAREFDPAAGAITFEGEGGIKRITVYTKNSAGERDCVTFTVGESEENTESPSGGSTGNVSGGSESGMSVTALTVVAIVSAVILLAAAAFVIIIIWRRR